MLTTSHKQKGLSLVELMVSMIAGLIVIGGVTSVYINTLSSSSGVLKQSKLNQEMSALLNIMSSDLHRAGIWGNMAADINNFNNPQGNPFSQPNDTALDVFNGTTKVLAKNMVNTPGTYTGGDCIVFSYDTNQNGILENSSDILGFRRIVVSGVGVVQMRTGVTADAARNTCADTNSSWTTVTDRDAINVTWLNFTLKNSACINASEPDKADSPNDADITKDNLEEYNCYTTAGVSGNITSETRQVDITLTAGLIGDSFVQTSMTETVRVRNDLVTEIP